jgi:hypothetical protein
MMLAGIRLVRDIKVGSRYREESSWTDIDLLASSIVDVGLINAITIDSDDHLIAGWRRLKAYERLRRHEIPVHIVRTLADQQLALAMERGEVTEKIGMANQDLAMYAVRLATLRNDGDTRSDTEQSREVTFMIAPELGVGKTSVQHFLRIGRAAQSSNPKVHEIGVLALKELAAGGGVELTSERLSARLRDAEVPVRIVRPARGGQSKKVRPPRDKMATPDPNAPDIYKLRRREEMAAARFQRDIIGGYTATAHSLVGISAHIIEKLTTYGVNDEITPEERERWYKDIARARTALGRVSRAIKGGQENGTEDGI